MTFKLTPVVIPATKPFVAQIFFAHLMLLLVSLPFDRMYSHLVLISFALQTVLGWKEIRRSLLSGEQWKKIGMPAAIFFFTLIGLIYTPQAAEGRRELLLQVPLLLMPLLLMLASPYLKGYRDRLLMIFSLVSAATAAYLFGNVVWTIHHFSLPSSALLSPAFTNHNFSEPIKMHATYLSMQWALAFIFLMQHTARCSNKILKGICVLCALLLLAGLIQLCSKSAAAALLLIALAGWPLLLNNSLKRRRAIGVSIAVVVLLLTVVLVKPAFRARYLTDLRADFGKPAPGELAEPRIARWMAALEIAKTSPWLGQGAGTEKTMLHEVFYRRKYYNSFLNHLNAHCEYLSLLFKNGVVALLIYLLVLGLGFRQAFQRRDLLYFSFLVLVGIVSVGENILDLDKGVYFYSLFFSFFIFLPESLPNPQPYSRLSRNHRQRRSLTKPDAISFLCPK